MRREIKIVSLRKLARKPYKVMAKYQSIYTKFSEIRSESLVKQEKTTTNGKPTNGKDSVNKKLNDLKSDDEIVDVEASDNSNEQIIKHKMNGEGKKITAEEHAVVNDEEIDTNNDIDSVKQAEHVVVLD